MKMFFIILILSSLFYGCKPKQQAPIHQHESEIESTVNQAQQTNPTESLTINSETIFSKAILQDQKLKHSTEALNTLHDLNEKILAGDKSKLKEYDESLLAGCNNYLEGCLNISFFKQDPKSALVSVELAKKQENIWEYYKRLFIAFDINNERISPALEDAYMQKSFNLIKFLQDEGDRNKPFSERHIKIISLISKSRATDEKLNHVSNMLTKLAPWQFSHKNLSNTSQAEIFVKMVKSNLYKDEKLNPDLVAFLNSEKTQKQGFWAHVDESKSNLAIQNINIKTLQNTDEYFYIVDRLFNEHIEKEEALSIWNSTHKDTKRLVAVIQSYLQLEFLHKYILSNAMMKKLYNDNDRFLIDDIISDTFNQATFVSEFWYKFLSQSDQIQSFLSILTNTRQVDSTTIEPLQFIKSLKNNIKFFVVYPHMLLMTYHMGKKNYSKVVPTMFGQVTVQASSIIKTYFQGRFDPWFNYGNDNTKLNSYEIIQSFEMVQKLNFFQEFNIDANDFFLTFAEQLLGPIEESLDKNLQLLDTKIDHPLLPHFNQICSSIQSNGQVKIQHPFYELENGILLGRKHNIIVNSGANVDSSGTDINPFGNAFVEELEKVRIAYMPLLNMFDLLVKIYVSNSKTELKVVKIDKLKTKIQNFISKLNKKINDFEPCFHVVYQEETKLTSFVLNNEISYLKKVHNLMSQVRQKKISAEDANKELNFANLPQDFKGFNKISDSQFYFTQIDFLIRSGLELNRKKGNIQFEYQVPSNIRELDIYEKGYHGSIYYNEDVNEFVRSALRIYFSFYTWTNWFQPYSRGLDTLREIFYLKSISYRMGPLQIQGKTIETTAQDVIRSTLLSHQSATMPDYLVPFFQDINHEQLYEQLALKNFWTHPTFKTQLGYFDVIAKFNSVDFVNQYVFDSEGYGSEYMAQFSMLKNRILDFKKLKSDQTPYVFSNSDTLIETMRLKLKSEMELDLNRSEALISAIKSKYEEDVKSNKVFQIRLSSQKMENAYYLSDTAIESVFSRINEYRRIGKDILQ